MLLAEAASRRELGRKASVTCDIIYDWCSDNRLELSVAKTMFGKAGRRAASQRPPTVKMKGELVG